MKIIRMVEENQYLEELRKWMKERDTFIGRTDDEFLLIFLRGCKCDLERAKKKMTLYYENRKRMPQWWTNRTSSDLQPIIQRKANTVLIDKDPDLPILAVTQLSRISEKASDFDLHMKLNTIYVELAVRRVNCQLQGCVWIVDCRDYPFWLMTTFLRPTVVYNCFYYFYWPVPIRVKAVHMINFPRVAKLVWQLLKPFLSPKLRKRFHFYGSDWSSLKDHVEPRLLPEEYGGTNGSLQDHEDAFLKEIHAFSEYLKEDDEKFGFK